MHPVHVGSDRSEGGAMNLRTIDLNLLTVLDALVEQRSVSNAAVQLRLSQSATSHALQRLRQRLNDEVLVRRGGSMQPTPLALRLLETIRPALAQIATVLGEKSSFDPESSTRAFVLRISEYVSPTVLTPLCTHLRRTAPGVRLNVLPVGAPQERGIEPGEIHLRAERGRRTAARPTSRVLFEDRFAVVMAATHPAAAEPLTLQRYLSLPHIKVMADAVGTNMIDEALEALGLQRRVVMSVSSWFEMRRVVLGTDLVAAVPKHWTADAGFATGCACRDLPLDGVTLSVELAWHARDSGDSGIAWMRELLSGLCRGKTEV
jgi:DNA-binding transcriptional LysR family regulator